MKEYDRMQKILDIQDDSVFFMGSKTGWEEYIGEKTVS